MSALRGAVSIVMHAHLPLIRHPENPCQIEEFWFFEAMADCYLPLLRFLDRLAEEAIPGRFALSISPSLLTMMDDELLRHRFESYMEKRIQLCRKELERTEDEPTFHRLAGWYLGLFEDTLEDFQHTYQRDLATALADRGRSGQIELITCAGTHAILPLLSQDSTRRAHVHLAVDQFRERFGFDPKGLWLPECAYEPGLERHLLSSGIRYTVLEGHALATTDFPDGPPNCTPWATPGGLCVFPRDRAASAQVWSASLGYPGDVTYREFYRDLGHDLDPDQLKPFSHPDGIRVSTGLKYHRITQDGEPKLPYEPDAAAQRAREHAAHFVQVLADRLDSEAATSIPPPFILCAFDAELFGHWWFEGPQFLEHVFRQAAILQVDLVTPGDYLDVCPILEVAEPVMSSWGYQGYLEAWVNPDRNAWIYRYLHHAERRLVQAITRYRSQADRSEPITRALAQAVRELMLAQASDWSFILNTGTAVPYAVKRFQDHVQAVHRLVTMVESRSVDQGFLSSRQEAWSIFPHLGLDAFFERELD